MSQTDEAFLQQAREQFRQTLVDAGFDPDEPLSLTGQLVSDWYLHGSLHLERIIAPDGKVTVRRIAPERVTVHG